MGSWTTLRSNLLEKEFELRWPWTWHQITFLLNFISDLQSIETMADMRFDWICDDLNHFRIASHGYWQLCGKRCMIKYKLKFHWVLLILTSTCQSMQFWISYLLELISCSRCETNHPNLEKNIYYSSWNIPLIWIQIIDYLRLFIHLHFDQLYKPI